MVDLGIRIPSERLSMPTPTDSDLRKLDAFVELGVDMVAVSYVRSAHDVRALGLNRTLVVPWSLQRLKPEQR